MKTLFGISNEKALEKYTDFLVDTCCCCGCYLGEEVEYWLHVLSNGTMPNRIEMTCGKCGGKNIVEVMWKPYFKVT